MDFSSIIKMSCRELPSTTKSMLKQQIMVVAIPFTYHKILLNSMLPFFSKIQ